MDFDKVFHSITKTVELNNIHPADAMEECFSYLWVSYRNATKEEQDNMKWRILFNLEMLEDQLKLTKLETKKYRDERRACQRKSR